MNFSSHPKFEKEINKFLAKHHQDDGWIFKLQNLLTNHFEKKTTHLTENVLVSIGQYQNYGLWKITMVVGGVRKNQCPRVCFSKLDTDIIFLCFGTHIDNYKTSDLIYEGKKRLKQIIEFQS